MGVAVTMASYAAVLRPHAPSTRTPRGPRRPAGAVPPTPRRAALRATTRSPPAVAATPPPRERVQQQQQPGDGQTTTRLYSLAPCPLLLAALLPGAEPVRAVFEPFVELVKTWGLPGWLVHWGHPGNMVDSLHSLARHEGNLSADHPLISLNFSGRGALCNGWLRNIPGLQDQAIG